MSDSDSDNLTGQIIWPGCSLLLHWMDQNIERFSNLRACEVGAGTGVCSLFLAKYASNFNVVITDGNELVVELMEKNQAQNHLTGVESRQLMWGQEQAADFVEKEGTFDIVFGSEIAYDMSVAPLLYETVKRLLKPNGKFIIGPIGSYPNCTNESFSQMSKTFEVEDEFKWDSVMPYKMDCIDGSVYVFKWKQ